MANLGEDNAKPTQKNKSWKLHIYNISLQATRHTSMQQNQRKPITPRM